MKKLEHIGIAIKNLEDANQLFSKIFNTKPYKNERVEEEKVITSFFKIGDTKIELLEGEKDSAIAKFIEKKGEGIHHLAFEVENIETEMQRLKKEGFTLINTLPKRGADNKKVCFLHPKTTGSVLIELCQEIKENEN